MVQQLHNFPESPFTGLLYSVQRFVLLVFVALRASFLLDETLFPDFLQEYDVGHSSFMAVILLQHRHTHPILMQLPEFFTRCRADERETNGNNPGFNPENIGNLERGLKGRAFAAEKGARARTHWKLAHTLMNNPSLIAARHNHRHNEGGEMEPEKGESW